MTNPWALLRRIAGIMSIFYYALLSRRAFQMTTYGELPGFQVSPTNRVHMFVHIWAFLWPVVRLRSMHPD